MQTFLPLPDFTQSAQILDYKRLGKQRQEAVAIYGVLTFPNHPKNLFSERYIHFLVRRYQNHPAVNMWRTYESALLRYALECCLEWLCRGYKDTTLYKVVEELDKRSFRIVDSKEDEMPYWFGVPEFHASHRSNLLRKDPDYYSQYCWEESDNLPYVWPEAIVLK